MNKIVTDYIYFFWLFFLESRYGDQEKSTTPKGKSKKLKGKVKKGSPL